MEGIENVDIAVLVHDREVVFANGNKLWVRHGVFGTI